MLTTHKELKKYNLFSDKKNKILKRALLISNKLIEICLYRKIDTEHVNLYNYTYGKKINSRRHAILEKKYFPNENKIKLIGNFSLNKNYIIKIDKKISNYVVNEEINVILDPSIGGVIDTNFDASFVNNLGLTFKKNKLIFKIWSPPACKVELVLFNNHQEEFIVNEKLYLKKNKNGVWTCVLTAKQTGIESLEKLYYRYNVYSYGKIKPALDPYAKSMAAYMPGGSDEIGKAAIIDIAKVRTTAKNFDEKSNMPAQKIVDDFSEKEQKPSRDRKTYQYWKSTEHKTTKEYKNHKYIDTKTDIIIYEINVRDFSIQPNTGSTLLAGTYRGFVGKIDYLKQIGITHVQLMPVNKCYNSNDYDRDFTGKSSKHSNYNWGYDPMNFFTPDGRYSSDAENPYLRIIELKNLINNLHNNGIGVILDVVLSHTYAVETFENVASGCYYRHTKDFKISGHNGTGATLESRNKIVRKLIIDVLTYFVKEFHIDGFRFDSMNYMDKETLKIIRKKVGAIYNTDNINDLILHGEVLEQTDLKENTFTKLNYSETENQNIGIFNDSFRDACAGTINSPGFILGNYKQINRIAAGIVGDSANYDIQKFPFKKDIIYNSYKLFADSPADCLNYFSIHNGLTMWDKINICIKDESKKERLKIMKLAAAVLFCSQGKIVLHGGDEILRTKPLADFDKEQHKKVTSINTDKEEGTLFFHENSYCSNDYTNMFRWDRLSNQYKKYANELLEYFKGLIKMRRNIPAFRYSSAENICKGLRFIINEDNRKINKQSQTYSECYIAYKLDNTIEKNTKIKTNYKKLIIIHNAALETLFFKNKEIYLCKDKDIILDYNQAGTKAIKNSSEVFYDDFISVKGRSSIVLGCK